MRYQSCEGRLELDMRRDLQRDLQLQLGTEGAGKFENCGDQQG